jgi:plasmid stabilization system protein ParE
VTFRFLEIAQRELDEAVAYYNSQAPGLGDAFLLEAVAAIDRISRFPLAWQPLGENIRRCRFRRFPYGLIYHEDQGEILIVAVAHSHRRPDYWRDRLARP